jgi:hypothetical protein
MHAVLAAGLQQDPDKRFLDLDRLASWAGPMNFDVSNQ